MTKFDQESAEIVCATAKEALSAIEDNVDEVFQVGPGVEKVDGGWWVDCRVWVNDHQVAEHRLPRKLLDLKMVRDEENDCTVVCARFDGAPRKGDLKALGSKVPLPWGQALPSSYMPPEDGWWDVGQKD